MDTNAVPVADLVAVMSAAVSVIALAFNLALTRRQTRISVEALKFNNDSQVMAWANRVLAGISEAQHLCVATNVGPLFLNERSLALATTLSALIDEGRWFFPNVGRRTTDPEKPGAYRGTRQAVLEHLIAVYESINELQRNEDVVRENLVTRIVEARRQFVSEVQLAIDPRRRAWVMDRFRKF